MNYHNHLPLMTLIFLCILGVYNGLLVLVFYMVDYPSFLNIFLLFMTSIVIWYLKKIFSNLKFFVPIVFILTILVSLLFTQKLYVVITGIYLDGTAIMSVNNKLLNKEDSKQLKILFLNLEEYNTTVWSADPTYTLSYMGKDDLDYRHIHVFKEEKLVIEGCLLGVKKGDVLEGYLLTNELLNILER